MIGSKKDVLFECNTINDMHGQEWCQHYGCWVLAYLMSFFALDEVLSVNMFVELDKVLGVEKHIKVPQNYCHIMQFICISKDWQDVYTKLDNNILNFG
jgi:hypothetical protein